MKIASLTLFSTLIVSSAFAATLNVPGTYSTIQACVDVAQPGDTCLVSAGSYAGATMKRGGSAGNRITLLADASGAQPTITGNINVSTYDYITVQGFHFDNASVTGSAGATYIEIKGNTFDGNNKQYAGGINSLVAAHVLIDGNTFINLKADIINQWGQYWVIRNNIAQRITDTYDVHLDFWQTYCGNPTGAYTLIENNLATDITGGNVHFFMWNNATCSSGDAASNYILRHNRVRNMPVFVLLDDNSGSQDISKIAVYNNTVGDLYSSDPSWEDSSVYFEIAAGTGMVRNEIVYRSLNNERAARIVYPGTTTLSNSIAYYPGQTLTTAAPLTACVSSGGCKINQDPLFTNYAADDFSLQAGSPAIEAGGALTTVAVSDSGTGTTLLVNAAYPFQDGWAGVQADTIAVGNVSNTVQIASIDYATNTITLASAITRNNGDPVFLFRDSDGTQVLRGTAPDIGAVESYPRPVGVRVIR